MSLCFSPVPSPLVTLLPYYSERVEEPQKYHPKKTSRDLIPISPQHKHYQNNQDLMPTVLTIHPQRASAMHEDHTKYLSPCFPTLTCQNDSFYRW